MFDVFIDTSGFYAALNRREDRHVHARDFFASASRTGLRLFTSNFIVAESHALLLGRRHREIALQFLRSFDAGFIHVERATIDDERIARQIIEQYSDKDFSLTDATSFAMMRRFNVNRALTFDRDFVQFGVEQA